MHPSSNKYQCLMRMHRASPRGKAMAYAIMFGASLKRVRSFYNASL